MWEFVDHVVYINLDKRTDRNARMKQFFKDGQIPDEKVSRFSAIQDTVGAVGCLKSHIGVLELAIQNKWKNVLILEDDVAWNKFEQNYKILESLVKFPKWDVCMLGGWFAETYGFKVLSAICGHAYLVNAHYYSTILANFQEGLKLKLMYRGCTQIFHNDVYWIKLQLRDHWYGVLENLCVQIENYSDIQRKRERTKTSVPDPEAILFTKECRRMFQTGLITGIVPIKLDFTKSLFGFKQLPR